MAYRSPSDILIFFYSHVVVDLLGLVLDLANNLVVDVRLLCVVSKIGNRMIAQRHWLFTLCNLVFL